MDVYLKLDLLVLALPLALSFDHKVAFWRKWPQVLAAIAVVLMVFGAWDVWKTAAGVWGFNPHYVGDVRVLGLPPGEWLFFVVVPYACLFILECVRAYFRDRAWRIPRWSVVVAAGAFTALACWYRELTYTSTVFLSVAVAVMLLEWGAPATLRSRCFWVAMSVTYLPFLIANGVLTGLPIVWYDDVHILAIRVGSIPLEDFFYSFSMLALAVLIHDRVGRWRGAA
jgi:lycopene cyclase domain-containing protein